MNAATVYLYKRADSASIDWENTLTYTFASGALSEVPTGWSQTIPTGDLPIYITFATASSRTATDTIPASEWSTPEVLARNGNNAITVVLTNESHIFAGDTEHVIPTTINCGIAAYKGATPVAVTIGTIANVPTGMTVTPSGSGTTNASIAIAVTAAMTSMSGTLNIPVTVDGFSLTKVFSYSVALNGESATSYDLNVSHAAIKKSEAGVYGHSVIYQTQMNHPIHTLFPLTLYRFAVLSMRLAVLLLYSINRQYQLFLMEKTELVLRKSRTITLLRRFLLA